MGDRGCFILISQASSVIEFVIITVVPSVWPLIHDCLCFLLRETFPSRFWSWLRLGAETVVWELTPDRLWSACYTQVSINQGQRFCHGGKASKLSSTSTQYLRSLSNDRMTQTEVSNLRFYTSMEELSLLKIILHLGLDRHFRTILPSDTNLKKLFQLTEFSFTIY